MFPAFPSLSDICEKCANMEFHFAYITAESMDEARHIGQTLIREQLVACINIIEQMESMFMWEGEFQNEKEVVVIAKTRADLVSDLIERVKAVHSYDCPCVVTLPVKGGNADFLNWIAGETRQKSGSGSAT